MDDGVIDDAEETAFPASPDVPGQAESRSARQRFTEVLKEACPWYDDYLSLRSEGWDWRRAAYIAWASQPTEARWPDNQEKLAADVLGLKSDRTIRNWRRKNPKIDERVAKLQVEPLFKHRRDVIDALVSTAKMVDPKAFQDRRTFLEMTGDYKPKVQTAITGADGGPVRQQHDWGFSEMDDDGLDQLIGNLQTATRAARSSAD